MEKWIMVTGASSGIGREIAIHLDDSGYNLVIVARSIDKLKSVANDCKNRVIIKQFDLKCLAEIEGLFDQIASEGIVLDGLVHCAGIGYTVPIKNNNINDTNDIMTVNYCSFVEMLRLFGNRRYSNNGSSVVAISSISALTCYPGATNYAASKSAVNAAVRTCSKEFLRRKIRINAILPAYVNAPLGPAPDDEVYLKQQPLGIIEPEYVAYFTEYLLSDKGKYMTGTLFPISGGMSY